VRLPRFRVVTIEGWGDPDPSSGYRASSQKPTLSAHVLDSLYLYELVATYRSTDRLSGGALLGRMGGSRTRGFAGAIQAAQDHADRLNAIHKTWLHREHMKAKRGELASP
jgi:hypothetical protein